MQRISRIKIKITGRTAGAADARNKGHIIFVQPLLVDGFYDRAGDNPVAAARAPDMRQSARAKIFFYQLFHYHNDSSSP